MRRSSARRRPSVNPERLQQQLATEVIDGPPEPFGISNPVSRAVARRVMAGEIAICETCCEQVKFRAKRPHQYMILATIVDEEGNWVKNEYYHPPSCYDEAGAPYGPVYTMSPQEGVDLGISEPKIKEAI